MNIARALASVWLQLTMLLALLFGASLSQAQQFVPVPALTARVTDNAGMLTAQQRSALENVLSDYESQRGSQIAVLLVPSTAPEAIEQYSIRVVEAWKLGRKGVDDGVLLVVAKDNPPALRRLRIEAGRGVQGTLTDAQSKRVLQDVIAPHFRQNDYYGGLVAGVGAIATLIDKEQLPGAKGKAATTAPAGQATAARADGQDFSLFGVLGWVILAFFGFSILSKLTGGGRSRRHGSVGGQIGNVLLGAAVSVAFSGSSGGRSSGGGGFSGGGFGGGGGSFDGGGASGDW